MTSSDRRTILILSFVSLGIRLLALWLVPEPHLPTNATIAYIGAAQMLVDGKGFSDPSYPLFTPPLYAILIGGLMSLFGAEQLPIKIVQVVADTATVAILYMIVAHIFASRVALLAATLWAIYPFAIYATVYIGTETLFTFWLALFVLMLLKGIARDQWQYFCIAGVVLGLATLTRGTTQFLPFILPFLWFLKRGRYKTWLANSSICLIAFGVTVLPWSVRNYVVVHDVIPVATAGGVFLWGASEELLTINERNNKLPDFLKHLEARGVERPSVDGKPTEVDRYMIRAATEHYKEKWERDPIGLIRFLLMKFCRLWYATESGSNHALVLGVNAPLYILGVVGIIAAGRMVNSGSLLLLCLVGYFIVLHWAAFPLFRYMMPSIPFVMSYAAVALCNLWDRIQPRPCPPRIVDQPL